MAALMTIDLGYVMWGYHKYMCIGLQRSTWCSTHTDGISKSMTDTLLLFVCLLPALNASLDSLLDIFGILARISAVVGQA